MTHSANSAHPPTLAELANNPDPEKARRHTNRKAVEDLLADKCWHPNADLLAVGGTGYGARVNELRKAGWEIEAEPVKRGEWRYRAKMTGGYEPRNYVLNKQAHRVLVRVLTPVYDRVSEDIFDEILADLPESWQDELDSPEAWERAGSGV